MRTVGPRERRRLGCLAASRTAGDSARSTRVYPMFRRRYRGIASRGFYNSFLLLVVVPVGVSVLRSESTIVILIPIPPPFYFFHVL